MIKNTATLEKDLLDMFTESIKDLEAKIDSLTQRTIPVIAQLKDQLDMIRQESNVALQRAKNAELLRDPKNREQKLDVALKSFDRLNQQVAEIKIKADALLTNNFIEIHSDEKIDALYKQSGMALKEISAAFNVSQDQAFNYAHGNIQDIQTRDRIVKFFKAKK